MVISPRMQYVIKKIKFFMKLFAGKFEFKKVSDGYSLSQYWGDESEVKIPASYFGKPVTEIGEHVFALCKHLKRVIIPDTVLRIGRGAFFDSSIEELEMPDSVLTVDESAFLGCGNLQSVRLSRELTSIGQYAFCRCFKLKQIEIPRKVTKLEQGVFSDCTSLVTIVLRGHIEEIDLSAFGECSSLERVEIPPNNPHFCVTDDVAYDTSKAKALICLSPVKEYVSPPFLTAIGARAFAYRGSLRSVIVGDSVKKIESMAFCRCVNLAEVKIPQGCIVGNSAFMGCSCLTEISLKGNTVDAYAFSECTSLRSVKLSSDTTLGYGAFSKCGNISFNEYCGGLYLGDDDNPYSHLIGVSDRNAQSIKIHDKTVCVNHTAFRNCKNVRELYFPDGVRTIGQMTFYKMPRLEVLSLPLSVTQIGAGAFNAVNDKLVVEYRGTRQQWQTVEIKTGSQTEERTLLVKCVDGETSCKIGATE